MSKSLPTFRTFLCELYESHCTENRTVRRGINELLSILFMLKSDVGEIWYKLSVHSAVEHFRVWWKSAQGRLNFANGHKLNLHLHVCMWHFKVNNAFGKSVHYAMQHTSNSCLVIALQYQHMLFVSYNLRMSLKVIRHFHRFVSVVTCRVSAVFTLFLFVGLLISSTNI